MKNFEFTFETGWKLLRAVLEEEGIGANTPRESIEKAFQARLIDNEKVWIGILKDRNLTVHTYDRSFAETMVERIRSQYLPEFRKLLKLRN